MEYNFSRAVLGEDFESGLKFRECAECALKTKYAAGNGDAPQVIGKCPSPPGGAHDT